MTADFSRQDPKNSTQFLRKDTLFKGFGFRQLGGAVYSLGIWLNNPVGLGGQGFYDRTRSDLGTG